MNSIKARWRMRAGAIDLKRLHDEGLRLKMAAGLRRDVLMNFLAASMYSYREYKNYFVSLLGDKAVVLYSDIPI